MHNITSLFEQKPNRVAGEYKERVRTLLFDGSPELDAIRQKIIKAREDIDKSELSEKNADIKYNPSDNLKLVYGSLQNLVESNAKIVDYIQKREAEKKESYEAVLRLERLVSSALIQYENSRKETEKSINNLSARVEELTKTVGYGYKALADSVIKRFAEIQRESKKELGSISKMMYEQLISLLGDERFEPVLEKAVVNALMDISKKGITLASYDLSKAPDFMHWTKLDVLVKCIQEYSEDMRSSLTSMLEIEKTLAKEKTKTDDTNRIKRLEQINAKLLSVSEFISKKITEKYGLTEDGMKEIIKQTLAEIKHEDSKSIASVFDEAFRKMYEKTTKEKFSTEAEKVEELRKQVEFLKGLIYDKAGVLPTVRKILKRYENKEGNK